MDAREDQPDAGRRLDDFERRIHDLEGHVEKLMRRDATFDRLAKEVARLRAEVEEFQQM